MASSSKHLPADERRAITVQAVVELASLQNPADITTGAIAKHMGVTQGALFRHFPNKESIWEAVMEWVSQRLLLRMDLAVEGMDSPLQALEAMFMHHVDFVCEYPGVPRMMFGEMQRAEITPAKKVALGLMQQYAKRLHLQIENGKACGEITSEVDSHVAATLFIGTIQGMVVQSLMSGDLGRVKKNARQVFSIYRRGLARQS